jgi:hypothetical protein
MSEQSKKRFHGLFLIKPSSSSSDMLNATSLLDEEGSLIERHDTITASGGHFPS